ncbi:MAG: glycosyltransferase family 2 protein [Flavobacterium sp.]
MSPFFSIIIPTFRSEKTLENTLKSIFSQKFSDFEIILVDGKSDDQTLAIANSFQDPRIKVFSEPDKGVYDAMNKGIGLANGEWLYFIGSDDYLYDDEVLQIVSQKLQKIKNNVLYGNVLIQGDAGWAKDGQIYNGEFSLQRLLRGNICHQSIFYRRSFLIGNDLKYNLSYPIAADWDFNIQCRLKTPFTYFNSIIAVFNAGGISTGKTNNDPFLTEINQKYGHHFRSSHYPSFMQPLKKVYKWVKNKIK